MTPYPIDASPMQRRVAVRPVAGLWAGILLAGLLLPGKAAVAQPAGGASDTAAHGPLDTVQHRTNEPAAPEKSARRLAAAAQVEAPLATLEATVEGRSVLLAWRSARMAPGRLRIEHRPHGDGAFAVLDVVEAAPSHRYRVGALPPGAYDFRLKHLAADGAVRHSPVVQATVAMQAPYRLRLVSPTPARTTAQWLLTVRQAQPVRAVAYDMQGRRIATVHRGRVAAHTPTPIAVTPDGQPSGVYAVQVIGETFSTSRRITIIR